MRFIYGTLPNFCSLKLKPMRSIFPLIIVLGLSIFITSCGNVGEKGGGYSDMELNKPPKDSEKLTLEELADRSEEKMMTMILGENDQVGSSE